MAYDKTTVKEDLYVGYTRQFSPSWRDAQIAIRREIASDNSRRIRSWLWLAQTAFSGAAEKYDSVRVHATLISNRALCPIFKLYHYPMIWAGIPTATAPAGISLNTTAFAPTFACAPMRIFPNIFAPAPISTWPSITGSPAPWRVPMVTC